VLALLTTISSSAGRDWASKEWRQEGRNRASL
jgi:hypothetical protein